jgi:heme oxygenase
MSFSSLITPSSLPAFQPPPTRARFVAPSLDLRATLRAAIATDHAALDKAMAAVDLTDRESYARFLRFQAAALPLLEAALERAGIAELLPDWPLRTRTAALSHDLFALGVTVAEPMPPAPMLVGDAQALGAAYVLEGSRLGGQVMLRQVKASQDPLVQSATRFLSHGAEGRLWQGFLAQLHDSPAARRHPSELVAGARTAIGLFRRAAKSI